jgi:uncharacterized repeat protein (TIGR01451 family)
MGVLMTLVTRLGTAALLVVAWATLTVDSTASDTLLPGVCAGTASNNTYTLTANCTTTQPLLLTNGQTLDGAGHTITAQDPPGGHFTGSVVTNASSGGTMTIENLTINGQSGGFAGGCVQPPPNGLTGIFFNDAGGSVSNVTVTGMTQHLGCQVGIGLRANGITAARTVTLTNVDVSGFQKAGLVASGSMTMDVSGSTVGPPDDAAGRPAQNSMQYSNTAQGVSAGAGGTLTGNTIIGTFYTSSSNDSTAVLLYGANNVTLSNNTITGTGTNVGVYVAAGSHRVLLDSNTIEASGSPQPDTGVDVESDSTATLVGNTLSGWATPLSGAPNCPGTVNGTTIALGGDCTASWPFIVPNGYTLDGGSHTINGQDPSGGSFRGGIVTNGAPGDSFDVKNLTVSGPSGGFATDCTGPLTGIFFDDAGGSATNVTVKGITQHNGCQLGLGIRANGVADSRTVTLNNVTVTGFQKGGLVASGSMTMNVSNSTVGPPDEAQDRAAQNSVLYSTLNGNSASGSVTDTNVVGLYYPGPQNAASTAFLLAGAANVSLERNTITGTGTQVGVFILNSTGIKLTENTLGVTAVTGVETWGVYVDDNLSATLTCNTFLPDWTTNLEGTTQAPCELTQTIPDGAVSEAYQTTLSANIACPPATWTLTGGALPAGLTLEETGEIAGTPTEAGTFSFTVGVSDACGGTASQALTMTVASSPFGTLVVRKLTAPSPDPTNGQFAFTVSTSTVQPPGLEPLPASFSLANGGTRGMNVAAGTYTIAETVPQDWQLTSAGCETGTGGAPTLLSGGGALSNVPVGAGQTVTCTFTDTLVPITPIATLTPTTCLTPTATVTLTATQAPPAILTPTNTPRAQTATPTRTTAPAPPGGGGGGGTNGGANGGTGGGGAAQPNATLTPTFAVTASPTRTPTVSRPGTQTAPIVVTSTPTGTPTATASGPAGGGGVAVVPLPTPGAHTPDEAVVLGITTSRLEQREAERRTAPAPAQVPSPPVQLPPVAEDIYNFVMAAITTAQQTPGEVNPCAPEISMTSSVAPSAALVGEPVSFTYTVKNPGTVPLTDLLVASTLPSGVNFVSASSQGAIDSDTGYVTWALDSGLAPGASTQYTVSATIASAGEWTNNACSAGQDLFNNVVKDCANATVVGGVLTVTPTPTPSATPTIVATVTPTPGPAHPIATPPTPAPAHPIATPPPPAPANPIATPPTPAPAHPIATPPPPAPANPIATPPPPAPANPIVTPPPAPAPQPAPAPPEPAPQPAPTPAAPVVAA